MITLNQKKRNEKMTEETTYTCDKCGKTGLNNVYYVKAFLDIFNGTKHFDLCKDCAGDFKEWLKKK